MTQQHLLLGIAVLAMIGLLSTWSTGRKSAKKATRGAREITRMTGNAFRTLFTAAVIVGLQWLTVAKLTNTTAMWVALIVPALLAGASVARLLAVTEIVTTDRGYRR